MDRWNLTVAVPGMDSAPEKTSHQEGLVVENIVMLVITCVVAAYLLFALIRPEKF